MSSPATPGVERWQYREMGSGADARSKGAAEAKAELPPPPPGISEAEVALRLQNAVREAEERLTAEFQARDAQRDAQCSTVIEAFSVQRARYFRQVESDVVQLALAVARKILHREAALDPTLLHGLVRVALDRIGAEEHVRIRLTPDQARTWVAAAEPTSQGLTCEVIADETLSAGDCLIETDRGSVNCGIEEQLKGIEQSFRDLLARRPEVLT